MKAILLAAVNLVAASQWPYHRYYGQQNGKGHWHADTDSPELHNASNNRFLRWLQRVDVKSDEIDLSKLFQNDTLPERPTFDRLLDKLNVPEETEPRPSRRPPHIPRSWPDQTARQLFKHLPYPLDPRCTSDPYKWWWRTYDGSCNWMKINEVSEGEYGKAKSRDYDQHYYADGISAPRQGPNPRAVSNAFFRREQEIYYEHTPLLLGLVEFIMHDISFSQDSDTEYIDVEMPPDEVDFPMNTTLRVWRTEAFPGTGTSKQNPRENVNRATTWLDLSALYGSTKDVALKLRSFQGGKLLTQDALTPGARVAASYLPYNTMNVPTRGRHGIDPATLFAGGDPRTNEDWIMLAVHTLLLREHNRLTDVLAEQRPDFTDEELYHTIRLVMGAKFSLIGNAYQMAYFKDMPWPADDGFPLFREMSGKNWMEINPANTYPWPIASKGDKPTVVSAEMAVVYRFHEFIVDTFPIKDARNRTIREQSTFATGFNATGFMDTGIDNILRGITSSTIPNFKSGVHEDFRSAGKYRGHPFDIVVWSLVHEREQGLPTFNNYFRKYNAAGPKVVVPIRKTFEDFSNDTRVIADLRRLYRTPDDVDLIVGCQLDQEFFPHATIPKSSLIISLFSLIAMGNSDRFSVGFAAMRCLLVDKPWDCHPSNALEDLLWEKRPRPGHPNFRWYSTFWMKELDFQAHGQNLLWRLVVENTDIQCLQRNPLFPADAKTNPVLCALPQSGVDLRLILSSTAEVMMKIGKIYATIVLAVGIAAASYYLLREAKTSHPFPDVLHGQWLLGHAADFQNNPKKLLDDAFKRFNHTPSKCFGIKLASLTHFVVSDPEDIRMMVDDNDYQMKFSISLFLKAINMPIILRKTTFDSNVHANLCRTHLNNPNTLRELSKTMEHAAERYIRDHPLVSFGREYEQHETLSDWISHYVVAVSARCIIGADADNHKELTQMFIDFNTDVDTAIGLGMMLPSWLRWISDIVISRSYNKFRKILLPVVRRRRLDLAKGQDGLLDFMPFILQMVDCDRQACDLVAIITWIGLRNLLITTTSTLLDIINVPNLQEVLRHSLNGAELEDLDVFNPNHHKSLGWASLRSSMFESIRLCGSITGPARIISASKPVQLASDPTVHLPPGQIATLSSYWSHRQERNYRDARTYKADRFLGRDPEIGTEKFLTFGLKGPHVCPGRFYSQAAICVLVKTVLMKYNFKPMTTMDDEDKYIYHAGVVTRKECQVVVSKVPELGRRDSGFAE